MVIVALFCEMLPQLVVRNIASCLPSTSERVAALLALVLQRKVKGFFGVLEPQQSAPYTRHQSFSNVEETPGIILQVEKCLRLVAMFMSSSAHFTQAQPSIVAFILLAGQRAVVCSP